MRFLKNIVAGCGLFLLAILFDLHTRSQDMSRDTRRAWKWLIIAALLISTIRLLGGCTRQIVAPVRVLTEDNLAGATRCDSTGNIAIYLAPNLSKRDRKYVLIHEQFHVEQSKRFSSCARFVSFYRSDPAIRWMIESEAYCYEYKQKVKDGVNTAADWRWLTYGMNLYNRNFSLEEVEQYLPCEEVSNVPKRQSAPP